MSDMDELPVEDRSIMVVTPEEPKKNRGRWVLVSGMLITTAAFAAMSGLYFHAQSEVDTARRAQHAAEARPPKIVTKTVTVTKRVPTFGRSVLMGIFASGAIQQGVYDGSGNLVATPNDSTCSMEYTALSSQYTSVTIERGPFMGACEESLNQTMKTDTAQ